jgi:anti-anti-sigma factor
MLDETRDRIQEGLPIVILDMTAVEMINSAGAGILAAMVTSSRRQQGKICLVGLNDRCRKVLEFMHLHQFTCIRDTIDEARAG